VLDTPYQSESSNWEYIVQTVKDTRFLKVRPLYTVYASELSKPLLYPIEDNDIDFGTIDTFMFDLTNSCNLRCPFCYSSPQSKSVQLTDFDHQLISRIIGNLKKKGKLRYIQVGCDFEPLLSDKFESYAEAFEVLFKGHRYAPLLGIITNGILLDPEKLGYYIKAVGKNLYVRISFHSHKKEVFRSCVKGLDFDGLVNNIIDVRKSYPDVRIELCNVLTKLNFADIPYYLDYVFNSLKANIVHLRRADLSHLSDDKRAKLELEQSKFAELQDWLSSSDSYDVSPDVCFSFSEISVWLKDTSFARWKRSFSQMLGVIRTPRQLLYAVLKVA
jgi:MoaA/NifB/PqqE/SkfB family radical SAM enzyme